MKKIILSIICASLFNLVSGQSDLIISGVIDGPLPGGLPKAIEIFVLNDVSDLSIYGVGAANNGGGTDGQEFTFPAVSAAAGDFIYIATEITQFNNFLGFDPDYTGSVANINGDDAIELFQNSIAVDVFGDINTDGNGEPWEYLDVWAYRQDVTMTNGGVFDAADWNFSGPNALDGEMTNATASIAFPTGIFLTTAPLTFTSKLDFSERDREFGYAISPTLAQNEITIDYNRTPKELKEFSIVNIQGNIVGKYPIHYGTINQVIDVSTLASGLYFVTLENTAIKFFKQ